MVKNLLRYALQTDFRFPAGKRQLSDEEDKTLVKTIKANEHFLNSLGELPLFKSLDGLQRRTLFECATVFACEPGEVIFREGEPAEAFYILKNGRVKMRRLLVSGKEVVLHLSSPPHMIGCKGLTMPGSRYPADAVAVDNAIVLRFQRASFLEKVAHAGDVFFSLLVELNHRLSEIYSLQAAAQAPVEQRIAILVLNQLRPQGRPPHGDEAGTPRTLRITKGLIAAIVGTTTETCIRILSKWKKAGLIDSERGKTIVLDIPAIVAISQGFLGPGGKLTDRNLSADAIPQNPLIV